MAPMVSPLLATLALKVALIASFCALYALGGQGIKQFRRFVLPAVYVALCGLILWLKGVVHIAPYLALLLMFVACNPPVSYGEKYTKNKPSLKVLFRGICGLLFGLATSAPIYLFHGNLQIIALNCLFATGASILLGVINPFTSITSISGNKKTILEDVCIALAYIAILTIVL